MNNFKKIGMTALAGSLVSTSVFAGEMAVTGSAGINFENYSADTTAGAKTSGTVKRFMGNQLTFTFWFRRIRQWNDCFIIFSQMIRTR